MSPSSRTAKIAAGVLMFVLMGVVLALLRRRPSEPALVLPSPASSLQLADAESALRAAIEARAEGEAMRANALREAQRTLAPSGSPGSCDRAITSLGQAELEALVAITDLSDPAPRWSGPRVRFLEGALAAVERSGRSPLQDRALGAPAIAANARALAALPETRFDFQLVVEDSLAPTVTGKDFSPGYLKGTLLAYDHERRAVVCGARLAGANRSDALARLAPRARDGRNGEPEPWTEADPAQLLAEDLRSTTLKGAAEKLSAMAPIPR